MLFGGLVLVFLLLWGLSLGRTRAIVSLLGIYVAYTIAQVFPYIDRLHGLVAASSELYVTRVGLFSVLYLTVFAILNKSLVKNRMTLSEASLFMVSAVSILQLGLLISIITNMLPAKMLSQLPSYVVDYFSTSEALFYWFLVPVIVLLFIKREKHRED